MVQDYFKYDKIQGGTPLSINANDGTKTEGKQGVTLGIKSTAQGLQHFTNWNDVSSSIDAKNTVRFEDGQPNQLYYKTNRSRFNALSSRNVPTDNTPAGVTARVMGVAEQFGNYYHEFTDEWYATDIKILDNIAVVAYPDYTDLHRTEQTFTGLQLRQPVRASWEGTYGGTPSYYDFFQGTGMVFAIDEGMPLMHKVGVRQRARNDNTPNDLLSTLTDLRTSSVAEAAEIYMSNQAYAFENTILKIKIPDATPFGSGRYLYFVYGGAVTNTVGSGEQDRMHQSLTANPDGSFTFDDFRFSGDSTQYIRSKVGNDTLGSSRNWTGFSDGDFAGYFYLITEASSSNARELPVEDNPSGKMHIQLSITHIWGFAQTDPYFTAKYQVSDDPILSQWHGYVDVGGPTAEATFIKYTPVRKCGKVDIYTKKSGIISAVLGHTITSPGHTLQTHDIIKITSALWDGTQTGAKDTHPLNGNKFVKIIDDDTFELYEDQFFEKPVSTTKLRTTTGIAWVCIGNANSNEAQSWRYSQTLFSPTGKNGYRATTTGKYKTTTRYNKAFLSGATTRTFSKNAGLHVDFSCLPGDYVPLEESSDDRNWGLFYTSGVSKKISGQYTAANLFGKRIREFIESTPLIDFGTSPLDTFSKGPQDFFPFTTAAINADSNPPYNGTRFGAAIDMKFSHNSGTSKVYTLVVGEPGSDTSVDMFGVSEEEYGPDGAYPHWVNTTQGALNYPYGIINTGRKRVFPYYLPHGKIHIFTVTVDQYGRISDITAQNSVFGDGSSVNNTCSNEEHPWETFMTTVRSSNYVGVNTTAGRRQMQGWSFKGDGTFDLSYISETNGDRAAYIEDSGGGAPFNETLPANSSLYWDRAAIANWMGVNTYDYFINKLGDQAPLIRRGPVSRNIGFTNTVNIAYSRFGSGINQPVIDRFNWLAGTTLKNQFYILPWVDMFGKSVAVSNCNAAGEILVFGSASVRSNIDYHSVSRTSSGAGPLRPVITVNSGLTSEFADEYSVSQMGQISCIRVDRTSSYDTTQIVEINAGGSVDSSTTPVDSGEVLSRVTTGSIPFTIKELRTGEKLAGPYSSILRSFKTSGMSIVFDGEYLIWGEHDIGDSKSKLNLLRINYDNNSFQQFSGYTSTYVSSTKPNPNHEGLGEYISFSDGVLVTNALTRTNSFGVRIDDGFVQSIQMYDNMLVFTIGRNGLMYHQSLSATFSGLDTRYTAQLLKSYEDNILDIGNINYDNHTFQSHTWNIRLAGQYSTIDKKILLKDPIEYVLFAPNYTYSSTNQNVAKTYSKQVRPYLEFTEIFKDDTVYYDYSLSSRRRIQDKSLWDTVNSTSLQNTENITRTPVFFLNIPVDSIDQYGNLTITINKDSVGRILGSSINVDSFTVDSVANNYDSLVPQIALYRKDPRAMIVPNGPSATGSDSTSAAIYTNGIYDYTWSTFRTDDPARIQTPATPPLFRGGANDLFHYSSNPGTIPTLMVDEINSTYDYTYAKQYFSGEFNLGELFDSTYNDLGNVDKGLISWFANDIRSAARNANVDRGVNAVPYGQIFSEYAQVGTTTYTFTIPYSTWSPYIVRGSLLKDSSQNRPFFGSFTRIKHGTAGVDVVDPSSGTWDYTYNDTSRPTYVAGNIASDFHLMLGLVFTRHSRMTQSGAVFYNTTNPVYNLARFMGPSEQNNQRYSSNYSYNPIFGGVATAGSSTNFTDRAYVNNLHLETLIDGIGFDLNVTSNPKRRFIPKYHKIAYFEYNDSLYSETQRNDINATTNKVDRYAFGKYSFVPYPVGPIYNARTSPPQMTASSTNPIIRVGKSSSSTQLSQGNVGSFNDSIQVMATENVGNSRTLGYGVTVYYADDDTINFANTAGASLGTAYFDNRAMLGSFDIEQPEGLSLFISVVRSENDNIPLMVRNQYASGDVPLYVNAHGFNSGVMTLQVLNGKSKLAKETDLYIYGKNVFTSGTSLVEVGADISNFDTSKTLQIYGVVGSGAKRGVELFLAAPLDYPGDTMPLWIGRDILSSGLMPLFTGGRYVTPGWTVSDKIATLHMSGAFNPNAIRGSGAPLYILGPDEWIVPMASGAPLYITTDIPETGVTGSWMYSSGATLAMVEDNNQSAIELVIEGAIASTGSIPLFIQRPFANAVPLVIKNQNPTGVMPVSISGAFIQDGNITLAIAPPEASGVTMYTRGYVE